ncbi:teichoic acids export ABC transporter ATP-binding subunit TagH [Halalkalibacillus sediminis]|uniref:Teichoic acids export ABC transporter ATP-binding subunit TagH n=1 Tax=Halalkalibacillus sediminis TaxID=2018042 RepID=A0A2I0QTW0_9BACI|nr:teichoic acids export ABC transporter ATP-binding subunit TagH [Halalkalibacillus sediminis]PKR77785.1 teichoic acids export ABC transporter ATP-binding subunit TagH [Halalkalibacillus sediminis]
MSKAVIVENISKKYKLYGRKLHRLLDLIIPGKSYGDDFYALRDVSFDVDKGDIVGFIGVNGSGKSTLSNIIAGVVPQTSGELTVNGQTALIAVNVGLDRKLTGRENIELKLLMLGFSMKEVKQMQDYIIEFSELGKFIDQPVKTYSSGMKSRLGFSISVSIDPDILIIDEALSVGDKAFSEKSFAKMREFKEAGKTMFFVSHSMGQMKKFCEKIVWLEFGKIKMYGDASEVLPKYEAFLDDYKNMSKKEKKKYRKKAEN